MINLHTFSFLIYVHKNQNKPEIKITGSREDSHELNVFNRKPSDV